MDVSIAELLAQLEKAALQVKKLQAKLKRAEKQRDEAYELLAKRCRPAIEAGIAAWNEQRRGYQIDPTKIGLTDSLERSTIGFYTRLRGSCGGEPDEEFMLDEVRKYNDVLKPVIDAALKEAGLPFTFSGIQFPSSYYMK